MEKIIKDVEKDLAKTSVLVKCNKCNDTGKIKYKHIEFLMYSWDPWLETECSCQDRDT